MSFGLPAAEHLPWLRSFVEISKRGIWSPQRVAQERADIRFRLLAIDFLPAVLLQSAMRRLARTLASNASRCLPLSRYSLSEAGRALRQLSQVIMSTGPGSQALKTVCAASLLVANNSRNAGMLR